MATTRRTYRETLENRLQGDKLIWFGVRGCDANPLAWYSGLRTCVSFISPTQLYGKTNYCLEEITGVRVNLDHYDIDEDRSPAADQLRAILCQEMNQPCVVIPYRSRKAIDAAFFPRSNYVRYLGLFQELQAPFEHKIWVETELNKIGIKTIPWRYLTTHLGVVDIIKDCVTTGPKVLRLNKSSGGTGFRILNGDSHEIDNWSWINESNDGYFSIADLMSPSLALSVSACAFPSGETSIHPFSVQIIGDPKLTNYSFGFCGSDFGLVKELPTMIVDELENMTQRVGRWLSKSGFIGAFGLDAIIWRDELYLTEVNPRFLGSSYMSAGIDEELDRPDVYMAHMAAFFGLKPPRQVPLAYSYKEQSNRAQIIYHNQKTIPVEVKINHLQDKTDNCTIKLIPSNNIFAEPGATLFRILTNDIVATNSSKLKKDKISIHNIIDNVYKATKKEADHGARVYA